MQNSKCQLYYASKTKMQTMAAPRGKANLVHFSSFVRLPSPSLAGRRAPLPQFFFLSYQSLGVSSLCRGHAFHDLPLKQLHLQYDYVNLYKHV